MKFYTILTIFHSKASSAQLPKVCQRQGHS